MANIRRFSDLPADNANRPLQPADSQNPPPNGTNLSNAFMQGEMKNPHFESFWDMLYTNLFPRLSFFSFAVFLSILLTVIFAAQLATAGVAFEKEFLQVKLESFTKTFHASAEAVIGKRELYRLLTCWMIHEHAPQLVHSVFMLLLWVSFAESLFGVTRSLAIFVASAVAGVAFGVLFAGPGNVLMGASPGLVGLMGASLGFLLYNWQNIDNNRFPKVMLFFMVVIIIILSLLMASSLAAAMLQVGSIFAGLCCGMFLSPKYVSTDVLSLGTSGHEKTVFAVGLTMFVVFLGTTVTSLFFMKSPSLLV